MAHRGPMDRVGVGSGGRNRVHDPVVWTRGNFPDVHSRRMRRRKCVKVCDGQLSCCVSEVVASDVDVAPQFVESSAEPRTSPFLKESCDATKQEAVVVIVLGTCGARVCVMVLDSL